MATELTDLDLGEWSICIDPANEDSTIEIVKSKSGLAPVLKETDMSDHVDTNDGEHEVDADFQAYAEEHADAILNAFSELSEEDQAAALVAMNYQHDVQEAAIEDAAEVVKALTENTVAKAKYDEVVATLKKSGELIEKMKATGNAALDDGGLVAEIRKANGGADLSPEAIERLERIEKAQAEAERKDAIAKAKTYGFGKAEDVADLETRIRKALGDKDADLYAAQIKQAGAVVKSAPHFKPIGEDAGADANDPVTKAKSVIGDIKKANPAFTEQQAFAKAIEQNPGLYRELEAARAAAAPRAA